MMSYQDEDKPDPLLTRLNAGDRQALRQASDSEVAASLRRMLDEQEAMASEYDSEWLMRAAWVLQEAGKWNGPAVAIAWLQARPSPLRLDIVLCLLLVAWNSPPGAPPLDPVLMETLLAIYQRQSVNAISENRMLLVLMHASNSGLPAPLAARVREILLHARDVPQRQADVKSLLDNFLSTSHD
jgi:hypothetical protein